MRKTAKRLIAVLGVLAAVLLAACLAVNCSYDTGTYGCAKCAAHRSARSLRLFGWMVWDGSQTRCTTLPLLRQRQEACVHRWSGPTRTSSARGVGLFEAPIPYCTVARRHCEAAGNLKPAIDLLGLCQDNSGNQDSVAFFLQQASGVDFGITFDDANRRPVVPADAVPKIRKWWDPNGG